MKTKSPAQSQPTIAFLHYTAAPVIGGVEAVIQAQAGLFLQHGYQVSVIAGRGAAEALPAGAEFRLIPELDSQHAGVVQISSELEHGDVPEVFEVLTADLVNTLRPILRCFDHVMIHNVFTKHFNLPLTVALHQLLSEGVIQHGLAWCHDFTWTSPHSRSKVRPGYPWDLLRTMRRDVTYVVVSQQRQFELAELFNCPPDMIQVIYNGVDPDVLWGLSAEGRALIDRLDVSDSDLILLMPVRVTQAKNIEYALHVMSALKLSGCRACLIITGPPDPHDVQSMAYFHSLLRLRTLLRVEREVHFVFESGPDPEQPYLIDNRQVAELFRISDALFMPSLREGFGMPVLEAGLVGLPVICTEIPAAQEIGGDEVIWFNAKDAPESVAGLIRAWARRSARHQLRRRVRQNYTWSAIFQHTIEPILMNRRPT
ncbi:MAG TPA: glycosyltransferase family 4 protein [Anaerolineae bacterium]|nr:glycosyltransferase family 4 protein [Anaerolineae bacterium]